MRDAILTVCFFLVMAIWLAVPAAIGAALFYVHILGN